MFKDNKYTETYFKIIEKYKDMDLCSIKCEKHHIVPKSMGGSNGRENIVKLPIKAHYVCHHLLIYMTTNSNDYEKMIHAFWRMCNTKTQKQKITAKSYTILKERRIDILKNKPNVWLGRKHSELSKEKMSIKAKGRNPHLYENYNKPKIWNKGKSKETDETIKRIADNKTGSRNIMYGKTGKNHPNSKKFAFINKDNIIIKYFYTRLEFKQYCIDTDIPNYGLYKTLKENSVYLDSSKNKRYAKYNGYYLKYV